MSESTVDSISCRRCSSSLTRFQHFCREPERHALGSAAGTSDKRIVTRIDWLVSCVSFLGQSIVPVRIFYTSASPLRASICDPVMLLLSLHTWKYLVQECQLWKVAFQKLFSSSFLPDQWRDCGSRSLVFTHALDRLPIVFGVGVMLYVIYYLVASTFSKYITLQFNQSQEGILSLAQQLEPTCQRHCGSSYAKGVCSSLDTEGKKIKYLAEPLTSISTHPEPKGHQREGVLWVVLHKAGNIATN